MLVVFKMFPPCNLDVELKAVVSKVKRGGFSRARCDLMCSLNLVRKTKSNCMQVED